MSQLPPQEETRQSDQPATVGLEPGALTLRQAADALGSSTTALRKMIRQGSLPEAEKVKTPDGRVWSIPADSIPGIATRTGFSVSVVEAIDLRDPESLDTSVEEVLVDPNDLDNTIQLDAHRSESWRLKPAPSETAEVDLGTDPVATPIGRSDFYQPGPVGAAAPAETATEPDVSTALQSIGAEADIELAEAGETLPSSGAPLNDAPTFSDVLDTALLEKLLGAKEAETVALVQAERHRSEYDALAARQLEVERRYADVDLQRSDLADRLQSEALARAISDARVTELRDQLQREVTYAEAERYERRQALARETKAAIEAAEIRAALGWWGRRKLGRRS